MNNNLLLPVLAGVAAGVAGAVVTTVAVMPSNPAGAQPAVIDDGGLSLQRDVAALIVENESLLARVRALEERPLAPVGSRSAAPLEPTAEQIELDQEMRALVSAMKDPKSQVPAALRNSVADALTEIRAQEQLERDERRRQQAEERMNERMVQLTEQLGLDAYQATQMRTILDKQNAFFESMRSGRDDGNFADLRGAMGKFRDETNLALTNLLTPDQYAKYQETAGRFGAFGGRGDRGNQGGGPGAGRRGGNRAEGGF